MRALFSKVRLCDRDLYVEPAFATGSARLTISLVDTGHLGTVPPEAGGMGDAFVIRVANDRDVTQS